MFLSKLAPVTGMLILTANSWVLAQSESRGDEQISFELSSDQSCSSGYRIDDLQTVDVEDACLAIDLQGYQASAYQAGVALIELETGVYREVWPLDQVLFSIEARPIPDPAVSGPVYFTFVKDGVCPSGYAGRDLYYPKRKTACLLFDLSGTQGVGQREVLPMAEGDSGARPIWEIKGAQFKVD